MSCSIFSRKIEDEIIPTNDNIRNIISECIKKYYPKIPDKDVQGWKNYHYIANGQEAKRRKFFSYVSDITHIEKKSYNENNDNSGRTYEFMLRHWSNNTGSFDLCLAAYYWFHVVCEDKYYAQKIDYALFGDRVSYEAKFQEKIPGKEYTDGEFEALLNSQNGGKSDDKKRPDKLEKITLQKTEDTRFTSIKKRVTEHIKKYTADHYQHPLEDDFFDFIDNNQSGYWYLTSSPGIGKSAIMMSLASRFETQGKNAIPFYFTFEYAGFDDINAPKAYYHYACHRLSEIYNFALPENIILNAEYFFKKLEDLSASGRITPENPLILLIDSIDEMNGSKTDGQSARNILHLNNSIPSGVYAAVSERFAYQENSHAVKGTLFEIMKSVCIEAPEYWSKHTQTIEDFVIDRAKSQSYIFEHYKDDVSALEAYLRDICQQTHHRTIILKTLIYAPECWENGKVKMMLSHDLMTFFKGYLTRIINCHGLEAAMPIFCFGLKNILRYDTFAALINPHNDPSYFREKITPWTSQGLLNIRTEQNIRYMSIFHKSFYDFIKIELRQNIEYADVPDQLLGNIEYHYSSKATKRHITDEYIDVLLNLCLKTQNLNIFEDLLTQEAFWKNAARTEISINCILRRILNIPIIFQEAIDHIAEKLLDLLDRKCITDKSGTPYTKLEILQICTNMAIATSSDIVNFSQRFRAIAEQKRG